MSIFQIIVLLCWGAFLFYWAINWKKVKPTKFKSVSFTYFRFAGIILVFALILILKYFHISPSCQITWTGCHIHSIIPSNLSFLSIFGPIFSLAGVATAIIARRTLSTNWSATLDVKKDHELVTSGIYSYVRHPIYLGLLLMMIGTVLTFPIGQEILVSAVVFITVAYRIKSEENLMLKIFPKEYLQYKKRTKYIIPFIF